MTGVLLRASSGYLVRHPWQLLLALLGIATGVAVMVAVDLANESARRAFRQSVEAVNGAATHQVIGGPGGIDEGFYVSLRVSHGARKVAPLVEGLIEIEGQSPQLLGVDPFAESGFRGYVRAGGRAAAENVLRAFLVDAGALLLPERLAAELELEPGGRLEVVVGGRRFQASLAGSIARDGLVIADIATAQDWLGLAGRLTRIDVRGAETAARVAGLLPQGLQVLEVDDRTRTIGAMSNAFMTNLTAMSLLALLVGVFLIYNSIGFAVLQRHGLLGTLRALGVTRGEAAALILAEAAALGIVGSLLGVLSGVLLAEQLLSLVSRSINDLYFRVSVTEVALAPLSMVKGLAAGFSATLLAAAVPATEAAACRPRLAMLRSTPERQSLRWLPRLTGAGLGAALFALLMLRFGGDRLVVGLLALFLLIVGLALIIPALVRMLAGHGTRLAARFATPVPRLALADIAATLSRTGVAVVALAVAVSATVGVQIMVHSFRGAVADWLETTLQADLYVAVPGGRLDRALFGELAALPGIEAISSSRRAWLESAEGRSRVIALDMAPQSYAGTQLLDADPHEAWQAFEEEGAVLVSEPYAWRHGVARGDRLTLMTGRGERVFDIAGTYRSYDADTGAILMSRENYDRHWDDGGIDALGLYLGPGVAAAAVAARIQELSAGRQTLVPRSNRELREVSLAIFDRTFVITDVLYWLATGVAVIGILGAMLALQLSRARELAVLRALGMTPAQLGVMVALQSAVLGLLSGLAALPLGLVMARVLIDVINRRAFGWRMGMEMEPVTLLAALGLALGAALLAGLYPAWRAAGARPALAMREE